MKIEINLDEIRGLGITPNEYIFLKLAANNINVLIELYVNIVKLYDLGYLNGQVSSDGQGNRIVLDFSLTDKAQQLFYEGPSNKVSSKVDDWINDWRELFPFGVKSGGYTVRGDKQGCIKKMQTFVSKHPEYNKDLIFEATKYYVASQKVKNPPYSYMKLAHYFIEKDGQSELSAKCEEISDAIKEGKKTNIKDISNDTKTGETSI